MPTTLPRSTPGPKSKLERILRKGSVKLLSSSFYVPSLFPSFVRPYRRFWFTQFWCKANSKFTHWRALRLDSSQWFAKIRTGWKCFQTWIASSTAHTTTLQSFAQANWTSCGKTSLVLTEPRPTTIPQDCSRIILEGGEELVFRGHCVNLTSEPSHEKSTRRY